MKPRPSRCDRIGIIDPGPETAASDLEPSRRIPRKRLLARLDRRRSAVTSVSAPAGFGKTTAVQDWLQRSGERVAWLQVDPEDNDPMLLWRRLLDEAVRSHRVGGAARRELAAEARSPRAAIERLFAELGEGPAPLVLVLDDVHLIAEPRCLASIELAAGLASPSGRLILISRGEPRLSLATLRGRGRLARLGPEDLAFDLAEARELLLDRHRLELDEEVVAELFARTGGWPAALYMTALWLGEASDPSRAARELSRSEAELVDYLLAEVIGALDPADQDFMRRSSVLGSMSGALCDEVLGRRGSAAVLRRLASANLLVGEDRRHPGWYRYHGLLRRALLHLLSAEEPDAIPALRARAGAWLRRHEMPEEAAEQAREAGDHEALAALLAEHYMRLTRGGRSATVLRWVESIPLQLLESKPAIALGAGIAAQMDARPGLEVRRLLGAAAAARAGGGSDWSEGDEVAWLILTALSDEDGVAASLGAAEQAAARHRAAPELGLAAAATLGLFLELAGEPERAASVCGAVAEDPLGDSRPFAQVAAATTLALVEIDRGRPRAARAEVERGLELVDRVGLQGSPVASWIASAAAALAASEGRLGEAGRAAERSLTNTFDSAPLRARLLLVAAAVRARRGELETAREALHHASELIESSPDPGRLPLLRERAQAAIAERADDDGVVVAELTPAELRVLRLLGKDMTRSEIAAELYLSPNTVKSHQRSIYRKLGAGGREEAAARARAAGALP